MPQRVQPYTWNANAARYRDPASGRFISRDQVRIEVDRLVAASQERVRVATDGMRQGTIDLGEWDSIMRDEIKRTQLSTAALLRGGWNQMTPSDFGRVGAAVREQYRYLDEFVNALRTGDPAALRNVMSRAKLYPASARVTFHEQQTAQLDALGYTEERNVLHPAEHCDECLDQSAADWVPIGTLVPIGQRTCLGNDRCSMRYR